MDLSLVNLGLAAGAALAIVPLILHLLMRQTPKRIVFPALQLIVNRHKKSTKRLRIKNWLLLAARMALVAIMALALARPTLNATVPLGDRDVATALALVFDTSLSMGYSDLGKTRLDLAKEQAKSVLTRLPETSQVFVIDSGAPIAPAPVSPSAAKKRLDGLTLRAATRPLNEAIEQSYAALARSDPELTRRETYVLTDLARSAWEVGRPVSGRQEAEQRGGKKINTFVLRLSAKEPRDSAVISLIAEAAASNADEPRGQSFRIVGTVRNVGPATKRLVDFILDGTKRDQKELTLPADGQLEVTFETPPNLPPGLHQAELRLQGTDALVADDRRFVTFQSRPAFDVLVVYDRDNDDADPTVDGLFIAGALDPSGIGQPNRVELLGTNQMSGGRFPKDLKAYSAVFLNNVARLNPAAWGQLAAYARQGGGVVVGLGQRSEPASYNSESAAPVMPLRIDTPRAAPGGRMGFGNILDPSHDLFRELTQELAADLSGIPVFRSMAVSLAETPTVRVLLAFQDNSPALVERLFPGPKAGHVLVWTTPLSRRAAPGDLDAWNEFPLAGWSFLALMDRTVPFLSGSTGVELNYEAGRFVHLPLESGKRAATYLVRGPDPDLSQRVSPAVGTTELVVEGPEAVGQWKVTPTAADAPADASLGFSVNFAPGEASFGVLEKADLDKLFDGQKNYGLANSPDELTGIVSEGRVGHELYPWLMALILALITAEGFLANRFHRGGGTTPASVPARAAVAAAG